MISGTQGVKSAVFAQMQQQQALREADRAEQRARSLQAESRQARDEADRAEQRASNLEVEAAQAQGDADNSRRGVAARGGLEQVDTRISELREQIAAAQAPAEPVAPAASSPTVNLQGQEIGSVVNVVA